MDHHSSSQSHHQNPNQYYYQQNVSLPLYTQDVYLPDASTSQVHEQSFSHVYHPQQQQEPQFSYQRYSRAPQMQPPPLQQRPHSHPQHTQSYHHFDSALQQGHDQLRHAHSHPSLPRVSPPHHHFDTANSPSHTARSSPSATSAYSDPLSTLRDDLQVHAAAAALAQAAGPSTELFGPSAVPRLPPILQVEKRQVTTTATQAASAIRRRNEATFRCPVPGCGSTFTRRFNLKGHLRSHTSERPYACEWPGCDKAFARQHDCKRHYQLHSARSGTHMCQGCGKSFSRTDALNRHLRSEGGVDCRAHIQAAGGSLSSLSGSPRGEDSGSPSDTTDGSHGTTSGTPSRSRPPSV